MVESAGERRSGAVRRPAEAGGRAERHLHRDRALPDALRRPRQWAAPALGARADREARRAPPAGRHLAGRVRRQEGPAPRPHVTRAPRVVSLVPSVTETLLAWGITPVAVTRFCEQPHLLAVGGTKKPRHRRHHRAGARRGGGERRGEPPRRRRRVGRGRPGAAGADGRVGETTSVRPCSAWRLASIWRTTRRHHSQHATSAPALSCHLAQAVDDDERQHLRLVAAGGHRHRQCLRRPR